MSDTPGSRPHGVVAFGASAGGIDALQRVIATLPGDLPLAICVVLHIPAAPRSVLADIIARRTSLAVRPAVDGDRLEPGTVYVAPPDRHLLVESGRIVLDRGPKENGTRPAIDPLFRSVGAAYGRCSVGVVLSGALGDGAAGLAALAAAGGTVLVQDPLDATVPGMPEAAVRAVPAARVIATEDLGAAIRGIAGDLAAAAHHEEEEVPVPGEMSERPTRQATRPDGPPAGLTCPECHGPLWEGGANGVVQFRCRVGHTYNEETLVAHKGDEVEAAMWSAVEALEEHAELLRKVAARMSDGGRGTISGTLRSRADTSDHQAGILRGVLATDVGRPEPEAA